MTVQLLDYYGGYAELSPQEYFAAKVSCSQAAKDRFMLPEFTTSVQAYA